MSSKEHQGENSLFLTNWRCHQLEGTLILSPPLQAELHNNGALGMWYATCIPLFLAHLCLVLFDACANEHVIMHKHNHV